MLVSLAKDRISIILPATIIYIKQMIFCLMRRSDVSFLKLSRFSLYSKTTVSKTVEDSASLSVLTSAEMHKNIFIIIFYVIPWRTSSSYISEYSV